MVGCLQGKTIEVSAKSLNKGLMRFARKNLEIDFEKGNGGHVRIRTGVHGFAGRCLTTPPRGHRRGEAV